MLPPALQNKRAFRIAYRITLHDHRSGVRASRPRAPGVSPGAPDAIGRDGRSVRARRPHSVLTPMHDEPPPRKLNERTGKHFCIRCLAETPAEEFLANDHICQKCADE